MTTDHRPQTTDHRPQTTSGFSSHNPRPNNDQNVIVHYDQEMDILQLLIHGSDTYKRTQLKDIGQQILERIDADGKISGFVILDFKKRLHSDESGIQFVTKLLTRILEQMQELKITTKKK